ncbi:hypothetical protein Egran_06232, partial [Elaphomyces granulatus]
WETFYTRSLEHLSSRTRVQRRNRGDNDDDDNDGEEVDIDGLLEGKSKTTTTTAGNKGDDDSVKKNDYCFDDGGDDDGDDDSYTSDPDEDDPGTSWFSEYKAPQKVLHLLTSKDFPLAPCNTQPASPSSFPFTQTQLPTILDLGTGNGSMLALLRDKGGFRGHMVGVDYSPQSVQLARELQRLKIFNCSDHGDDEDGEGGSGESWPNLDVDSSPKLDEYEDKPSAVDPAAPVGETDVSIPDIRFEVWDILTTGPAFTEDELQRDPTKTRLDWFPYERGGFDIVLDKGTFDAVSLSDEALPDEQRGNRGKEKKVNQDRKGTVSCNRRICEKYPGIATKLVREGGFLVVTSCNWTEDEVVRWFTGLDTTNGSDDNNPKSEKDGLYVWGRVEYPRFRFGGQEGQGVCTVCFRRKAQD